MKLLVLILIISYITTIICQPYAGPCIQGTYPKSHLLNCTDNGYFQLTQCMDKYCVCVDPKTGHEAEGTRTFSNRILPRCGQCFTVLSRKLAKNQTNDLPLCDDEYGNYKLKQCTGNRCSCVNVETGAVLKTGGPNLHCINSAEVEPTLSFSLDPQRGDKDHETIPMASPICGLQKDRGYTCSNSSKVMYYYDKTIFQCLAFKYNGCGGNKNQFNTINECWSSCIFQDFGGCAGMKKPLKDKNGETIMCRTRGNQDSSLESRECPNGYKCTHLPFFSICCEQKNEELFSKNFQPKCDNNRSLVTFSTAGIASINLLGKTCSDDFCPPNSECEQLEILAHCCKKH